MTQKRLATQEQREKNKTRSDHADKHKGKPPATITDKEALDYIKKLMTQGGIKSK